MGRGAMFATGAAIDVWRRPTLYSNQPRNNSRSLAANVTHTETATATATATAASEGAADSDTAARGPRHSGRARLDVRTSRRPSKRISTARRRWRPQNAFIPPYVIITNVFYSSRNACSPSTTECAKPSSCVCADERPTADSTWDARAPTGPRPIRIALYDSVDPSRA